MIFYSYHDGENDNWFSSKADAIKDAREQANWGGHPVDVARMTIDQKPSAALILAIINNKGLVDKTEIVATVQPGRRSEGRRRLEEMAARVL